jgi:hypothetical protein
MLNAITPVKRFYFFFATPALAFMLLLSSFNMHDTAEKETQLVGTWIGTNCVLTPKDAAKEFKMVDPDASLREMYINGSLILRADKTYELSSSTGDAIWKGSWAIEDTKLVLGTGERTKMYYDIVEVKNNTLKLNIHVTISDGNESIEGKVTADFEKQ